MVECDAFPTASTSFHIALTAGSNRSADGTGGNIFIYHAGGEWLVHSNGLGNIISGGAGSVQMNSWQKLRFERIAGEAKLYINGVQAGGATTQFPAGGLKSALSIAGNRNNSGAGFEGGFVGLIDNVKVQAIGGDADADGLLDEWETANGLNPASSAGDDGAAGDPDGDGDTNLKEFAFGGNPQSAGSRGSATQQVVSIIGTSYAAVTFACRADAVFTGSAPATASRDGITYSVRGTADLQTFDLEVAEIIPAVTTGLPAAPVGYVWRTGAAFEAKIEQVIDVDQFMRTWAIMSLYGNDDQYGRLYEHNWRIYERPTDGRFIALPWDLDRAFLLSSNASLIPTTNQAGQAQAIQRLFNVPKWKRIFDSHILDIVATTANSSYLGTWATHLGAAVGTGLTGYSGYVQSRGNFALTQMPAAVPFEITSNGGADFSTPDSSVTITGRAWVDVYSIYRNGVADPLPVTWTGGDRWSISLPIAHGANVMTLSGKDQRFVERGTDTITVTGTGVRFDAGITYSFAPGTQIAPGARLVLPRRAAAFALRSPGVPTAPQYFVSTEPTGNQFSNGGERIVLLAADGVVIKSFTYDDTGFWPATADGNGPSLVLIAPQTNPNHADPLNWRASFSANGNPGATDGTAFTGSAGTDTNNNGVDDLVDFVLGTGGVPTAVSDGASGFTFTLERDTASQASLTLEVSSDLAPATWQPANATLLSRAPVSGTVERLTLAVPAPPGATRLFVRGKAGR